MLIQVGELAKRAGITVRTLHHYESLGLLLPSGRTAAGYRLYNAHDVQRLHTIQALTQMGLSLSDVRDTLENHSVSLNDIIGRQLAMLDEKLSRIATLRERLVTLQRELQSGQEPDLSEWLTTLELMTMYDRWFTQQELKELPFAQQDADREQEWAEMVAQAKGLIDSRVPPADPQAQALATRWMETLERDTAGKPDFLTRLNKMHASEPQMVDKTGITPQILDFITHAFAESKLAIYARYLSDEELAFTRAHYFDRMMEWPPLVAKLHHAFSRGVKPESEEGQALARHWLELFASFAGHDPRTHQKFRVAMTNEPHLAKGTWMTPPVLGWLQQAVAALMQAQRPASAE
ncbi:MerR family transcriptional regulator [Atlantibacter hermannii]|uniref:MerR family transcriptional regulator n=1 Tax=Atlantibacter hermannii TaxID=565 RepID=UPI0028A18CAB|nr:MerR family transcriptional regulator [Atlantibacter hermannii]